MFGATLFSGKLHSSSILCTPLMLQSMSMMWFSDDEMTLDQNF